MAHEDRIARALSDAPTHRRRDEAHMPAPDAAMDLQQPAPTPAEAVVRLQQSAGNRAVSTLLRSPSDQDHTSTERRGVAANQGLIQRHVAPGASATGDALHASLTMRYADALTQANGVQQAAQSLNQLAQGLMDNATSFLIWEIGAETYNVGLNGPEAPPQQPIAPGGVTTTD